MSSPPVAHQRGSPAGGHRRGGIGAHLVQAVAVDQNAVQNLLDISPHVHLSGDRRRSGSTDVEPLLSAVAKIVGQPGGDSGPVARAGLSASSSTMAFSSFEKADMGARLAKVGEAGRIRSGRDPCTR